MSGQLNGVILIADSTGILFQKTYGNKTLTERLQKETPFHLGSLSKPITAVATILLQQERLINIDSDVSKYLPDFPYINMTPRHLLSHTSEYITIKNGVNTLEK